jgi:hypothetical protein
MDRAVSKARSSFGLKIPSSGRDQTQFRSNGTARIGASVPTQTNFGKDPEWGTLAREINKKARHMPLRQLFGRIPNVLTQLAPYRRSLNFPVEINPITSLS